MRRLGRREPDTVNVPLDVPLVGPEVPGDGNIAWGQQSPESRAGPWGQVTFSWLNGLIAEGHRRETLRSAGSPSDLEASGRQVAQATYSLTEADLYELRHDDLPESLQNRAESAWAAESRAPQPSLRRALRSAFGRTFLVAGCFKFCYDTLQMVGPYILKRLLSYLDACKRGAVGAAACGPGEGLGLVALMCLSNLVQTALLHQYFHRGFRTGMRLNAATVCLVYAKSLRIAGPGRLGEGGSGAGGPGAPRQGQQRTTGEIVNLMSVDAQRLQDTMTYLHTLWSGPYQITITLIFLISVVHWATLAGLLVMLLQVPLVTFIARRIKLAQRALMKIKDERIKVTNEVFSSVRLLKMYAWEESFESRLDAIREQELRQLRKYQILNIVSTALYSTAPILTGVATFGVYTALYDELSAGTAFAALSLFNVLRFPLTMFPNMVSTAVEANVALSRIQSFLQSSEVSGRAAMPPIDWTGTSQGALQAVRLEQATLAWPDGTPLLAAASFSVPAPAPSQERAHLTVVVGSVGVGKSGLLQALIGDLQPSSGSVTVVGSIAYTSQVAWIRNATLRENVLFNSPVDEERYSAVLSACALLPDLEALPCGEATEIGEKGVTLSGGQRQRVSLARAVYAAPDLLLLDDPLSAVDPQVAKRLLAMLRGPLLRKSSVVLCTHHLGAIQHADQVILLERGRQGGGADGDANARSSATTEARIAFCGAPEDFRVRYPEMAAHEKDSFERQESSEEDTGREASTGPGSGRLVEKEAEQVGSVSFDVYKAYIRAAGGPGLAAGVLLGIAVGQALQTGADSWVSVWSDHSGEKPGQKFHVSSSMGLLGYTGLSMAAFFGIFATSALFRLTALNAARSFHRQLLGNMLKLPMAFYDTTPLGRVLSRFSKDVYTVDEQLQSTLYSYLGTLSRVLATLSVIAWATPWFLVFMGPLLLMYRWTQRYYVPSSRQLKRIESSLRSPIFSHFAETLDGVASIRAFGQQAQFLQESAARLRRNMRAYYVNVASNRWLAVRLETLGTGIVISAGLLAVLARSRLSAGVAGLSISYALSVTQALNWVVRMTSERETNIVSVERLRQYIQQTQEPPRQQVGDPVEGTWPKEGAIEFRDLRLRYRSELPLVLDGLSLQVRPLEKLGICGRTGAGKSSLLNVLLRIVDPEGGRVLIDGVDIAGLGLHRLRRSITVIPQDPVLFSGSLRFNLDPLGESDEEGLWQALRRAHLSAHVQALSEAQAGDQPGPEAAGLEAVVAEQGQNFSLGQRQQMCLARALIRSNRILLLDEATSAVDVETDALIQETIRKEFASHTVLCIAHRISTIMESDRVCVVEGGRVAEVGEPKALAREEGSRFQRLACPDAPH